MDMKLGYHITEAGVLPTNWDCGRLETLGAGPVPPVKAGPFGSSLTKDTYVPSGYKVYGQEQVIRGDHEYGDYYISPSKYRELASCAVRPGDVLISLVGTAGKLLVLPDDAQPGVINPRLLRLSLDRIRVLPNFLKYVLETHRVQSHLARSAQGGTMGVLNAGMLRPLTIPLPPFPEQKAIVAALSDMDALLGALDRLIAKKRDLKQSAMQHLLTGHTRLPGFRGSGARKTTEVGLIPEDWSALPLRALAAMKSGESITSASIDESSPFPCYGGNGLRGYTTRFTHDGEYALVGRQGALCGNVVGVRGQFFASEHAIVVTAAPHTDVKWLTYVLKMLRLNRYSESSAQPGLSVGKVLGLMVATPPTREEQQAIAAVLSDMDAELTAIEQRRDKTRLFKQGMMQELLIGRTRLA